MPWKNLEAFSRSDNILININGAWNLNFFIVCHRRFSLLVKIITRDIKAKRSN